jgi:hypothetical protein
MSPRKAVVFGCLLLLGGGAAVIACFGPILFHWYVTDELYILSRMRGGYYTAYSNSPLTVVYYLGIYGIGFAFGVLLITTALYAMARYWARLTQRDLPTAD